MAQIPFHPFRTAGAALGVMIWGAQSAFAQVVMAPPPGVQANPAGSGPINAALGWVEGTLLGSLATTAAVIAVAVVGLMMLTGRIDWRRGLTVILGAFILFGAATIVAGIRGAAGGTP
jgi:type IV secretion system protein VirB2